MFNKSLLIFLSIPVLLFSTELKNDDYEYLIVTTDALKNGWDEFVEFNKRRCLRTKVETIDYIKANSSGADDADKLRNYIKNEYSNHNIVYVLLGGDDDNTNDNDIPHRGFRAEFYENGVDYYDDKDIAADMYYSCLDGDWKDSNQYYGEYGCEDIGWDVYASRFPVDNEAELNAMINKTIKYSENPVVNEIKNALIVVEPVSKPEEYTDTYRKNSPITINFPPDWNVTGLSDYTTEEFINTAKEKKMTWIDHFGHANFSLVLKVASFQVTNDNFTNDGINANYFLVYSQGCFTASFDNKQTNGNYSTADCIGETFTAEIDNGAIAYIGNCRYGGGADTAQGAGQVLQEYFHHAIFDKKIHHLEMMNAYSKESVAEIIMDPDIQKPPYYGRMKYTAYGVNILGDPALSIWTETPQELVADHPDFLTSVPFEWDTKKPYTWVALLMPDDDRIITSQLTGEDGKCFIDDNALEDVIKSGMYDHLKINVKAHNYLPYQGKVWIPSSINELNNESSLSKHFNYNNSTIKINYFLSNQCLINISIYNSRGMIVKNIVNRNQSAGKHNVTFRSDNVSNGIYYLRMITNNNKVVKKFALMN